MIIEGNKYIDFDLMGDSGKTQTWNVINKTYGTLLGIISWYSSWRQYTFIPSEGTEYNNTCLDTITNFLTRLNKVKRILGVE